MVSIAVPIVSDPAAWTAATFKSPSDYTITFSDSDREELLSAARRIQRQGRLVPPTKLISSDFALHELGERLRRAFMQVRSGCGFVVLQGLPRAGVSFDQFAAVVWGITAHFGFPLSELPGRVANRCCRCNRAGVAYGCDSYVVPLLL